MAGRPADAVAGGRTELSLPSAGVYHQWQAGGADHRPGGAVADGRVGGDRDVAVAVQQDAEGDGRLEPGERGTEAEVDAVSEGEMRVRLAVQVEPFRIGEHPSVAVRRRQPRDDQLSRRDERRADGRVRDGPPGQAGEWCPQPERLLDR